MSKKPCTIDKFLDSKYETQGNITTLPDGLEFYGVGSTESQRGILLISDLFGWNTGRTRNLADYLGENGYYVVVPKLLVPQKTEREEGGFPYLFDFTQMGSYLKSLAYDSQLKPKILTITDHLKACGIDYVSILTYSWGGWVTAHILADPDLADRFTCAAIAHPNINLEESVFGGNTEELLAQVQKPLLFIPTRGDSDDYRCGGIYFELIKKKLNTSEVLDLPTLEHGFLPRGSIQYEENYNGIKQTMEKVNQFFQNHAS